MIEVEDPLDRQLKTELRPNSKPQTTFLALPDEIFEAGYGGTAGTGKTFALVTLPLFRKCHQIRGFYGKIWRRSFPQIQESLEPESNKWYPTFGFTYNSTEHVWTHKETKAQIAFGFLDKDKDALKHDSAQYHYLGFEECTQFTEFMYRYLLHRCRSDISGWTAICRNAATPGDIGNTWYRKRFVDPCPEGYRVIHGHLRGKIRKRIFCRAHEGDNVDLTANDPTYYDRLDLLPDALRKAKKYGDFYAFQGQVFEEFRPHHFPDEPDNALHVIDPFPIPNWWPKVIAIDWGFRHGNYVCWGAISPKGELIMYRDMLVHFKPIKEWGSDARRLSQHDGNIKRVVADRICFRELGEDKTLAMQIEAATGWRLQPAKDDRIAGKALLHELFRWTERPKKYDVDLSQFDNDLAQRILRIKGLAAYKEYVNHYIPDNTSELLPKFKVFSTCTAFIDCIQSCVYDEGEGQNRQRAEDVMKVDGDDPYDGGRYMAMEFADFISESKGKMKELADIEQALSEFGETQDYRTFLNRVEIIEATKSTGSRLHRPHSFRKHTRIRTH